RRVGSGDSQGLAELEGQRGFGIDHTGMIAREQHADDTGGCAGSGSDGGSTAPIGGCANGGADGGGSNDGAGFNSAWSGGTAARDELRMNRYLLAIGEGEAG